MAEQNHSGEQVVNPWLIAFVVSMATFMEVMDTSIANVALRYIAGSVGADQSESTWVLTSYLVSNAIVVPMSGWFAAVLGRKRFYMICVFIFTISSFLCGIAPSLGILLTCRIIQGIGGGGLAPCEQAILADTFPPSRRGMAFAAYGVAVVVAPALGPALGGWITDTLSWRWIFFINLPVGIASLVLTHLLVKDSAGAKKEHEEATRGGIKVDYIGAALVALGLGCLQVILDKGQEDDWMGSNFILTFTILSGIGIVGLVFWELYGTKNPIVDLPLLRNRSFLFTNIMMFSTLFILLSTTQLLPQFVQRILPYDATKAGLILMPGGLVMMAMMPIAGVLVRKVQPKYLIFFGFIICALALFHLSFFMPDMSFGTIVMGRIFQTIGFAFLFVPIQTLAYSGLPPEKSSRASALINVMRNLGGSVGISFGQTMITRHSQAHQNMLVMHLTPTAVAFQTQLQHLGQRFTDFGADSVGAGQKALAVVSQAVQRQAETLSYLDVFMVLMCGSIVAAFMTLFLKRMDLSKASAH
ncbi:MAG TPA: DHA2 family efflux MFS transporter permease subunit [Verrucomicrobiae bacterium]|jgi:DHA2 family multidrug resistance protein